MPVFSRDYLLDTDVLGHIQDDPDSTRIFEEIIEGIEAGRVKTVRQVLDELKRFDEAYSKLSPVRAKFEIEPSRQFCSEVSEVIECIADLKPSLFEQFGGKNPDPADPWLIAVAKVHGFTVVTDERPNSPKRIPMVCDRSDIRSKWISGPHFLVETGIILNIRPEQIGVDEFYRYRGA